MIVPSECSLNALNVLLNRISKRVCTYHFPVYAINDQPSNVVIIRNLPSGFDLESPAGNELKSIIENVCPIISINQAIYHYYTRYGVVKVTLNSSSDARRLVERIRGLEFHGNYLTADKFSVEKYLLNHDVNEVDSEGLTLLMRASKNGDLDVVEYLVNHGGDVNGVNRDGMNAIVFAFENRHVNVVKYLLTH